MNVKADGSVPAGDYAALSFAPLVWAIPEASALFSSTVLSILAISPRSYLPSTTKAVILVFQS